MLNYLLLVMVILAMLAALPFWDRSDFAAPPVWMWLLLAVGAVVMAFRGRNPDDL